MVISNFTLANDFLANEIQYVHHETTLLASQTE